LRENSVYVVFKEGFSFHRDKIEQAENRQTVENALRKVFAQPLKICSLMQEEADAKWGNDPRPGAVPAAEEGREEGLSPEEQVVRRAEELFGPDLVVVKE
jgi:DNA polymerase-3 subunit gamma/tau